MDMRDDNFSQESCHPGIVTAVLVAGLRYIVMSCTALGAAGCTLLVMTFLVLPRSAHATGGQCIWEGGPGANTYPECQLEDCMGAGGYAQCMDPVIRPPGGYNDSQVDGEKFDYGFDDLQELDLGKFCVGIGGTFNSLYPPPGVPACSNLPSGYNGAENASTEALAVQGAQQGMDEKLNGEYNPGTNTGGCGGAVLVADSGWGQGTTYQNGLIISDGRTQTFVAGDSSCNPTGSQGLNVYLGRTRSLQCLQEFSARSLPNGYIQCFTPSSGCVACDIVHNLTSQLLIDNPVSPVTGGKFEARIDFQAGGAGGLSFAHFYNSMGYFRPLGSGPSAPIFSDYWHFSYDRHLIMLSGNPQLTAVVHREDGTLEWFDGSGNEILNVTGAADRLVGNGSGGWNLTLANSDVESYDSNGNLTSITTRAGIVTTISYGSNGKMSQIADSFGHSLSLAYNLSSQLTTVTLPDGSSTITYSYGTVGQLTSVTYADQSTLSYEYEDTNNSWLLTGITDENGQRYATYEYDTRGLMVYEQHAGGVDVFNFSVDRQFSYSSLSTSASDGLGQIRSYVFSNQNGTFKLTSSAPYCSGCPNTNGASYDAKGNPQSLTDLNNNQTTYAYDQVRNLEISRTEGLNSSGQATASTRTTTTQWHPTLRLPSLVSVYNGASATGTPVQTTSYTYDGYGNVLTKTLTDGATGASRTWTNTYYNSGLNSQLQTADGPRTDVADVTSFTYYNCASGAQCGQIHTVTDALGHTTTFTSYDANGMPLTISDPNGTLTVMTYDPRQRVKTRTVGGEQSSYNYYPTGQLQKVTLPDGSYLSYIYDPAHRLTEMDDAAGDRLVYTLDATGNRLQTQQYDPTGALSRTQSSVYNGLGQLWQQLTSSGAATQATVYAYDTAGNQTGIQAPLARNSSNFYDPLSRLQQTTDPAGGNTSFGYDALDHLTSVTDPRNLVTNYIYNGLGDLSRIASPDTGVTQSTFDSGGNLYTRTDARGSTATYFYDALNRMTQVVYPDQTFKYTYDQGTNAVGRLSNLTDGSGQTAFTYDALGRVIQKQQIVGSVTLAVGYSYQNSQLTSLTTPSGQTLSYAYDTSGRLSGINVNGVPLLGSVQYSPFGPVSGWTWGNGTQTARGYDLDGHLTQLSSAGTSTYTFLDDGSIASRSDDTEHDYSVVAGATNVSVSASSNQLVNTTGTMARAYAYDQAGNTLSNGAATFAYNGAGRLNSAAQGTSTATFGVNALGQRVSKSSAGVATLFAYDELGHLIGEYTAAGGLIEETVWLGDTPVATLRPNASGTVDIYYVHTDHLNTPRRVTRASDNTIVWRWSSDPFGLGFVDEDPDADGQSFVYNLRFPGQYYDVETGLSYNYHRDYDPATGRYVESDPIGLYGGSYSTYAYVGDDPANSYDPSGLASPGRTAPSPLPPGPLDFPANPQPWSGDVAIALQNAIENIVNAIVDSRTIPKPAKPTCGCTCTCRADANDNIPGNIQPGDKTFAFGTATASNCGEASKQAKRIATRSLGKQPKHVGCRCTES